MKLLFSKRNYQLMLLGIALIVMGLFLMSGKDDIYGTMKITVAPLVIFAGFVVEIVAILHTPKSNNSVSKS